MDPFESVRFYDSNRKEIFSYKEIYDDTQIQTFLIPTNPYSKPILLDDILNKFYEQYGLAGIQSELYTMKYTPQQGTDLIQYYNTEEKPKEKPKDPYTLSLIPKMNIIYENAGLAHLAGILKEVKKFNYTKLQLNGLKQYFNTGNKSEDPDIRSLIQDHSLIQEMENFYKRAGLAGIRDEVSQTKYTGRQISSLIQYYKTGVEPDDPDTASLIPQLDIIYEKAGHNGIKGMMDYVNFLKITPYYDKNHPNYMKAPNPLGTIYYDTYDSMSGITPDDISELTTWAKNPPINKAVFFGWNRTLTLVQRHLSYKFIKEVVKQDLQKKIEKAAVEKTDSRKLEEEGPMLNKNLDRILTSMMIYLFGGEARLIMIQHMFDMLASNNVKIFIITSDEICPIEFIKLLTDKIPESNILCTGGIPPTKAIFLGQDPRLIHKKTKTVVNSFKSFFGYGGAGGKRTHKQRKQRKYNRKQKTQKRKSRK